MRGALIVVATVLALSGVHVRLWLAGCPVSVPVPVLILAAELAALGVLRWLTFRAARVLPWRPA